MFRPSISTWHMAFSTLAPLPLSVGRPVFPVVWLCSRRLHLCSPLVTSFVTCDAPLSSPALGTILPGIRLHPEITLVILANALLLSSGPWKSYLITPLLTGPLWALTMFRRKRPVPLSRL